MKKIWMSLMMVTLMVGLLSGCQTGAVDMLETQVSEAEATEQVAEESADTSSDSEETAATDESTSEEAEQEVIPAPDFTIMGSDGNDVTLSDYKGKVVFINFFTTWCKYCKEEMPAFEAAQEKYKDDLKIILVDVTMDANELPVDEVIAWYEEQGYSMTMGLDVDGALMQYYYVPAYPTTYFVDRDGNLIAYYPGAMNADIIDQVMEMYQ